jgi:predicted transcriptional regulator of viral defense system
LIPQLELQLEILQIFAEAQRMGSGFDPAIPTGKLTDIRRLRSGLASAQEKVLDALTVCSAPGPAGRLVGLAPRSARRAAGFLEEKGLVKRHKIGTRWIAEITERGWKVIGR